MNLNPKNKPELIQLLQKQRDFKVEAVLNGSVGDLSQKVKSLKPGSYSVIVIRS